MADVICTVAPVCRPGQKTIYSGGRQETIKVLCELEANPHNVTFNWKFNASATEFLDLPASQIFPERNNAVAQYTPMTEHVSIILLLFLCVTICKSSIHSTQNSNGQRKENVYPRFSYLFLFFIVLKSFG